VLIIVFVTIDQDTSMTALHYRFCILEVGLILVAFFLIKHWDTALFIRSTVDLQIERSPVSERVELYPDRPVELSPVSERVEQNCIPTVLWN
jgi:hypothetical protein